MRGLEALLWLLFAALPASAEVYRFHDAEGQVHFTEDLGRVPPAQRAEALRAAREGAPSRLQTFAEPAQPGVPADSPGLDSAATPTAYRIPVERAGPSLLVVARVNGRHDVRFLIDTGATDVLLPRSVARRLGLEPGPDTRSKRYATANGMVEHPVVMLDSVELGGALAREVPASIGPEMEFGLLGLSFFNRFDTHVDAAAGVVTLVPNGLGASGAIRGGRSEAQWRAEYHNLLERIARLEAEAERTPPSHGRELARLEEEQSRLERELELLDAEADHARVPVRWRE